MYYVFFDLNGVIGDYAPKLWTKPSKEKNVINLRKNLIELREKFKNTPATKENCNHFWTKVSIVYSSFKEMFNEWDLKEEAVAEIDKWVEETGKGICYCSHVKNIYNANINNCTYIFRKLMSDNPNSEEFIRHFYEWFVYYNSIDYENSKDAKQALKDISKTSVEKVRETATALCAKYREKTEYNKFALMREDEV